MRVTILILLLAVVVLVIGVSPWNRPARVASRQPVAASPSAREMAEPMAGLQRQPHEPGRSPATESRPRAATDLLAVAGSVLHSVIDDQACLAGTANAAKPAKTAIHRWIDDRGVIHFSDQSPAGPAVGYRRIEVQGLPPIAVHARGLDVNLPDDLVQTAISSAQAIDRILRGTLGVEGDPGLVLDVEFIASAEAWASRAGNPVMANSAGTYSPQSRTIRVRLQDDPSSNFLILRHEITHALIHERIGRLPTPINEGIAGYFEHLAVSGMGAQVMINESSQSLAAARIEGDGQAEMVELFAHDGADFYASDQQQRYLRAFALIAVLMDSGAGRSALASVLTSQRAQPCQTVKAEVILDSRYPGGLIALTRDWVAWLRSPPRSVRSW